MKKRIILALAALTILLCVPLIANAASVDDLTFDPTTGTITDCNEEAEGELIIPEEIDGVKVTSIGYRAFEDCKNLTSINIPNGVTSIGYYTFCFCTSLTNINIPNSVTSIGDYAFTGCTNLTSITIPDSVTSIGSGWTFCNCGSLNINVSLNNQNYCDIDGVLFTKDKKTIMAYAKDELQPEYTIPYGVTSIDDYAFCFCGSLTNITIPDSVTSIGYCAFQYCNSLTGVTIPDSVTSIGDWTFSGCTSLTNITIPNGVTSIGDGAFYGCESLTSINIPNGVTSIGDNAFCNCFDLTSVTIPESMTSIDYWAFTGCTSLTDVYYSGAEQEWNLIEIAEHNDELLNATIHFMIDPLEVQPVEPEKDVEANKIKIPVTVTDIERAEELNGVRLYIAEYDADGRLTNVTFGDNGAVEGDTITITADIPDAEHYKIMLWDGNNAPLMDAITNIL